MEKPRKPHDHFFRQTFGLTEVARDYLLNFLPEELVGKLQLDALQRVDGSFVSRKLRSHFSDIIYSCPLGDVGSVFITFLFEHKSQQEKYPHIQLLRYILEVWERAAKEKQPLPFVIPIILYHGKEGWERKAMSEYFPAWDDSLQPFLPQFDYLLTDLSDLSDQQLLNLRAGFLINTLLSLKHQGEKNWLQKYIRLIFRNLENTSSSSPEKNYIEMLLVYMLWTSSFDDDEWELIVEETPSDIKDYAMSTYDLIIKKGELQGIQQGVQQGIQQGVQQEKRNLIISLLSECPDFSDQRIARIAGAEEDLVRQIRAEQQNS